MILQMTRPVQGGLRQERKFEIIANHLANVNTPGFKADVLTFDQMLKANLTVDLSQGELRTTNNKLDLALASEGFFAVQTQQGIRYTRSGNFTLNIEGSLVTQNGETVLGEGGPITIEGTEIYISEDGTVQVDGDVVDRLRIVNFVSPKKLQKEGSSLFVYKGSPNDEVELEEVVVKQGALEMPNVSTVVEMVKMIEAMRYFESFYKIIQSFDETDAKAINDVGKLL